MLAGLMLVAAFAGGLLGFAKYRTVTAENANGKESLKQLESEIAELKKKGELVQKSLSPSERQLMVASHRLVAMKEFGWSRLLYDIETVLPADVSASRINVENVYKDGDVVAAELEFAVVSRAYPSVLNMIDRMNSSGIFRASLRSQDLQENDRERYTEYTLFLIYRPSAGFAAVPKTDVAAVNDGGASDAR